MLFSGFSARAIHPRYQEHRNRFSSHKVTAVGNWTDFGKTRVIPGCHAPKSSNLCICVNTVIRVHQNLNVLKKVTHFVLINSRKLYRIIISPSVYMEKKKQPPTQIVQISRRLLFSFFHEKTRVFLVFSSIYQWAFHFFRKNQKLFLGTIITVSYSCKQNLNVDDFGHFDRKRKSLSEQYCLNTKKYFFENTKVFQSNIA